MLSKLDAVLNQIEEAQRIPARADLSPLDFLRAVYLNEAIPLPMRMRAAVEAAPYIHPKLSATAILEAGDLAERLERAIERSGKAKLINATATKLVAGTHEHDGGTS